VRRAPEAGSTVGKKDGDYEACKYSLKGRDEHCPKKGNEQYSKKGDEHSSKKKGINAV
jgi:hypothetical protein